MQLRQVLIANGYLDLSGLAPARASVRSPELATFLANLAYYGYAPSKEALRILASMLPDTLGLVWQAHEPALRVLTGDDRPMAAHVVYKNFPREVLDKSQADYWLAQVCMYVGMPADWFAEPQAERPALDDKLKLRVLDVAPADAASRLYDRLAAATARWSAPEFDHARWLADALGVTGLSLSSFGFRENGVRLAAARLDTLDELAVGSATDVLRLAAARSGADVSLREAVTLFRRFPRPERRRLLGLLEGMPHLEEDFALRPALWKALLRALRPGDYAVPKVSAAYDALYRGVCPSFNASVEHALAASDAQVLVLLAARPGEFMRRLHKLYAVFGTRAVDAFAEVAPRLTASQLVKLKGYLRVIGERKTLICAPAGSWARARVTANVKAPFAPEDLARLRTLIDQALAKGLARQLPDGVALGPNTEAVRLPGNDAELAPYGRGTVFFLPKRARFIRTASYWQAPGARNVWYDNSWNFFDENWQKAGACCWNSVEHGEAAVFSGDPVTTGNAQGRACQLIDLYPDKLLKAGVRFALWSVLCYSQQPYSAADEVLATLQWGADPEAGNLYEPSRAQFVFPLKGDSMTKVVALIDFKTRKLVYLDVNLGLSVHSAAINGVRLSALMPPFLEYLAAQPTLADLLEPLDGGKVPVLYTDANVTLAPNEPAYVFRRENPDNTPAPLALEPLLA